MAATAQIRITGRKDPLHVEVVKARKIRDAWIDADPEKRINIGGVWAGRFGDIRSFDFPPADVRESAQKEREREETEELEQWLAQSPEAKGKEVGRFKLWYGMRYAERISDNPPKKILDALIKKQTAFFKKNPKTRGVPTEVFESVIPKGTTPKKKEVVKKMPEADTTETEAPVRKKRQSGRNPLL